MLNTLAEATAKVLAAADCAWCQLLADRFASPDAASNAGKLRFMAVSAELLATRGSPQAVQALLTRHFAKPLVREWLPSLVSSVRGELGALRTLPPSSPKREASKGSVRVHTEDALEPAIGAFKAELTTEAAALVAPLLHALTTTLIRELEQCVAAEVPLAAAPVAASLRASLGAADTEYDTEYDTEAAKGMEAAAAAALTELRARLRRVLDARFQRHLKAALYGAVRDAIAKHSGAARVARLGRQLETLEEKLASGLQSLSSEGGRAQLVQRYASGGSLRARLVSAALTAATTYEVRAGGVAGSVDMLLLAFARSRSQLSRDESELAYVLGELEKIRELQTSELSWRDVAESWAALLKLRSQLEVERGQAVLECIVSDQQLLDALGAATQLSGSVGVVPRDLLTILNQGPGAHIRTNGYRYHRALDRELQRVRRVKEIQWRIVTLSGSAVVAAMVGASNFFSRIYYDVWQRGGALVWVLPLCALAAMLLCCLACASCYACCGWRHEAAIAKART